ncbi:hypothetical protein KP509_08G066400 [Ceratopteris richardii]|uniref:F-box domain-containing protein n=1 Tax=Ceratopteris richardii TaxID=49495 RepID=A0A8T2U7I8_CERRI|nr:hypothetical protein KP509_08G066400 [Ceratopteris richardii]
MSLLRASDFCRMARVCRRFRNLADSDEVWATLVPSDPAPFLSRKDLFFRELAGMTRKDPSQPYWLDPETGEGFFVKSARQLHIVWGDDMRYWHWASQPDSWFPERSN